MLETIKNLFKIKSLITIATTSVFAYLAVTEKLPMETTTMIIGMVFTFYFTKDKNENKGE